jgi:hypothetical protein
VVAVFDESSPELAASSLASVLFALHLNEITARELS